MAVFPLVWLAMCAYAQQPAETPAAQQARGDVQLRVVVSAGRQGKPVSGLAQSSFTVLDNGAPQVVNSFRAVSGQSDPVKVLIVLDAVNVGFQRVAFERQELDRFLHANDGQLAQPTALAIFADTSTTLQPSYSKDGNAVAAELDKQVIGLRSLRRSAGFYGAEERLDLSLKTLQQLLLREEGEPGRKFLIWVTPGWPLLSGPAVQLSSKESVALFNEVVGFSHAIERARATLYAVDPLGAGASPGRTFYYEEFVKSPKKSSDALPGNLGIQVLAEQSGGRFVTGSNDIAALVRQCVDDAASAYDITYARPPNEGAAAYHRIEVKMAEPHLVARTRQGYYALPSASPESPR